MVAVTVTVNLAATRMQFREFRLNFIDDEARERIERRGITTQDIIGCINNTGHGTYIHRDNTVHFATLPGGRNIKVTIDSIGRIVNAFFHQ